MNKIDQCDMQHGRTLILGLGNPILGDDGVGIAIARAVKEIYSALPGLDVIEASLTGRFLLDVIRGYKTVIVTDAIMTQQNASAGSIYRLTVDDLGDSVKPYASHALDLRTTVELGHKLGYEMPETILIYAVEIKENMVFREGLSPAIEAAVMPVARRIMEELNISLTVNGNR
jgi:hydrogenase maturation protease